MVASSPGGVLALDLSGTTGWAYGSPGMAPRFGCWKLPMIGGEGCRYAAFENVLADAVATFAPGQIVLEASLSLQALASASTIEVARQQLTLRGLAYSEAYRASVLITEIDAYSVRLAMLGTGHFKKGAVKREVIAYCRTRGLNVPDHNAGDAVLTWLWQTTRMRGGKPVAGRLFAERETIQ